MFRVIPVPVGFGRLAALVKVRRLGSEAGPDLRKTVQLKPDLSHSNPGN